MASYQRVALFILFDAIEADLIGHIRHVADSALRLTPQETEKSKARLSRKQSVGLDVSSPFDLLYGLDLAEKYQVLMRHKDQLAVHTREYFQSVASQIQRSIGVRNDVMHGRPLTVDEHIFAFSFAQSLVSKGGFWPTLTRVYLEYADNPTSFVQRSIEFLDEPPQPEVMHNLPIPDYDDTGFLPRPDLERDLKKKILGRHPAVTVLGEGGNGKTALALQVLYGLVKSNDHSFEAIIWVSAKTAELGITSIREIQEVTVAAADVMNAGAALEARGESPRERLYNMLEANKILLVIDNYETIIGSEIADFAEDVPGDSKILFTSRLPVGSDLTVLVSELSPKDGLVYFYQLVGAYAVKSLKDASTQEIERWLGNLSYKPLLIKWFVLGVQSGLQPDRITANPETALRFCLDNVILTLSPEAQAVLFVLAILPMPPGAGVIHHVSKLKPIQVSDGLTQLSRFGLINAESADDHGIRYSIKSFSRSYVLRVISPKPSVTDQMIARYQEIERDYQSERAEKHGQTFSFKTYVIRSRSEMLISYKLKEIYRLASGGDFAVAEQALIEAKLTEPTYFETYRIESYLAQQQNDIPRALSAMQTAIKLDGDQLQLRFFYAGLLMRLNENDEAAKEFSAVLEHDRSNSLVVREAARNEMMRHNWVDAQALLNEAKASQIKAHREAIKLADLQIQLFVRKAEAEVKADRLEDATLTVEELSVYIGQVSREKYDNLMIAHLSRVLPTLRVLRVSLPDHPAADLLHKRLYAEFLN